MTKKRPVAERFWEKVETDGPVHERLRTRCWVWMGATNQGGYGRLFVRSGRVVQAHRFSWEVHNGPIPGGVWVCHHCDNPACVRPDHLFLGTQVDNMGDMISKGRRVTWNAGGAECQRGHPFSEGNTYVGPDGKRCCVECRRARGRAYVQRNRNKRNADKRARRRRANGGISRACADRTHCPYGHPYDADNTRRKSNGSRQCRACDRRRAAARRRRIREQAKR